jgi:hypothetical protein
VCVCVCVWHWKGGPCVRATFRRVGTSAWWASHTQTRQTSGLFHPSSYPIAHARNIHTHKYKLKPVSSFAIPPVKLARPFSLFVRKKKIIIITQANPHNNNNRDNNLFFFLSCRFSYHFLVWFDIFGILQPIDRNDNADRCFFLITITTFSRLVLVLASLLPSPSFFRTTIQKRHLHAPGSKYRKQLE